jgi:threonine 3-dehydrogenase
MAKLITGGTGYIGAELARILANRGEEVVIFDVVINRKRIEDIENKVKIIQGDLANWSHVANVIKDNHINEIYHLGSMLTYRSEIDPWTSFQTNVIGTYNVLEAARIFEVQKMMFTSTLGTFGLECPPVLTDSTIQRPITMYGCGKLYGEGLGRFYSKKFGLDFRSIRFAHMIGPNVRTPGHWAPSMIEDAILGKPNECVYGDPDTVISMIYVTDAARAADMVLQAPIENIKTMNYNVAGIPRFISAKELETILVKRFPGTRVIYKKDISVSEDVRSGHSAMKEFNDDKARKEWGWKPKYATPEAIIDIFQKEIKEYPGRYGLA